jgi:RNA recognition motif-containing protein
MGKYGPIEAVTIMRDPNGRSRGFAFLTYNDSSSVDNVLKEVHHLDGKQVCLFNTVETQLIYRSILNEPSQEQNTKEPPKSLLVVLQLLLRLKPSNSSSPNSDQSWTLPSCLIERLDDPRDSLSPLLEMRRVLV